MLDHQMSAGTPGPGEGSQRAASEPSGGPLGSLRPVPVVLRLFASARLAAGTGREEVQATTVAEVLADATARHGDGFAAVLDCCSVWVNGEPTEGTARLSAGDEVAILPPVSGGQR